LEDREGLVVDKNQTAPNKPILILGIGNLLMGNEGIGIHAINFLKTRDWPPQVTLLDGGTGGFHLLEYFQEYDPVLILDACMDSSPTGTVRIYPPEFNSSLPPLVSMHDVGLRDLMDAAALLGHLPKIHLITVSIGMAPEMSLELFGAVRDALPEIASSVDLLVKQYCTQGAA
jgi:hydrogenase maturation protease